MPETITMTTDKPVFVYYDEAAEPDDLHPGGVAAGSTFESPNPELAKRFHPKARILRYSDGSDYSDAKATRELRERDKTISAVDEERKAVKASPKRAGSSAARRTAPKMPSVESAAVVTPGGSEAAAEHVELIESAELADAVADAKAVEEQNG